ncbi:MAG: MucR family transcriptional regulator [Alphaproteobacteria bacterium]|nr:MucR family transcriptional regulator [Alphaproteobacteria bacterium]
MTENNNHEELLALTTEIVSAYVANNTINVKEIPAVIEQIFKTLATVRADDKAGVASRPQPAVPIKRSVTPDYIVCLEDGKKLKMLKRHLKTTYDMTPEAYRERWGLSADYPMVAENYARQRSELAKKIGLGKKTTRKKSKAA